MKTTRKCQAALSCSDHAFDETTSIRIMPISYAQSDHHGVRVKLSSYGHLWTTISTFYFCVVQPWLAQLSSLPTGAQHTALQHIILPRQLARFVDGHVTDKCMAYDELQTIFSGPAARLIVHRANWVPVCHGKGGRRSRESLGCCATNGPAVVPPAAAIAFTLLNASASVEELASRLQGLESQQLGPLTSLGNVSAGGVAVVKLAELNVNEPRGQTTGLSKTAADTVRRIAWENVGAQEESSNLVLWASSERASNRRKVHKEMDVVSRVREHLRHAWPALELMHARLTELNLAQEIRLMRRAAVFISLFGSALHNCRFMRPGAIVIEIRGAMKNDYSDFSLYANVCAELMGVRWAGLTTEGHVPSFKRDRGTGKPIWGKPARPQDRYIARINAAALISKLELALRSNFTALIHEYASNITWKDQIVMRNWAEAKLALPQYRSRRFLTH
uniref:Glycosyltransferase 61 catalytic domain-containing protein n=1 Tax=Haptolina brevifila TaxID=156173 RepID=A0A7S2N2S3_9EUKA